MLTICESGYKYELDIQAALGFQGQIKEVVSDLGCHVVKSYFELRGEPVAYIKSGDNSSHFL